jgi:hypothetical protein
LTSLGASTRSTTTSVASRNDACYASTTIEWDATTNIANDATRKNGPTTTTSNSKR